MELSRAIDLVKAFQDIGRQGITRPTIMELSGYPHYENVCSNVLGFYLDPLSPHGFGSLCLSALLDAAEATNLPEAFSEVQVEREVLTSTGSKLDLLITSDTHIIAIENKIFHQPVNPFEDYANLASERANSVERANSAGGREIVKILLGLFPPANDTGHGFKFVSHGTLIEAIRSRLGHHLRGADARYLLYLVDFLDTIESLQKGTKMDAEWLDFMQGHRDDIEALNDQLGSFRTEMRRRVGELRAAIDIRGKPNVHQFLYREGGRLFDLLTNDIKISEDFIVGIDAVVYPQGWRFEIFPRLEPRTEQSFTKVRDVLKALDIPFQSGGERLIYARSFKYTETIDNLSHDLQSIINKISEYQQRGALN